MALVIVESPNKIPKIKKILGPNYTIMASVGHIMDIEKKKMGIDVDTWDLHYQVLSGKKDIVKGLKDAAKNHDEIYIATDDDREGEIIAHNLREILPAKGKKIYRVIFSTITKKDIMDGIKNPVGFREDLILAQQARRITDRLVGFKVSPLMWTKGLKKTSAGRVQSAALKFIVDREMEIRNFIEEEYWSITAALDLKFDAEFYGIDEKKYVPKTQQDVDNILNDMTKEITVISYDKKQRTRSPMPPFITASMQKDAGNRFGWTGKKVMDVAQSLFSSGLISYHRCFPGYVKISTTDGYIPIQNILVGQMVDTTHGPSKVTEIVKNKNRKIYSLRTDHGYTLDGSNNEPLMVLNNDLSVSWKKMEDICKGEYIALANKENYSWPEKLEINYDEKEINIDKKLTCKIYNNYSALSLQNHLKSKHNISSDKYKDEYSVDFISIREKENDVIIPKIMTPELAAIIGYLQSDGCISYRNASSSIQFRNFDRELLDDYCDLFNKVFSIRPNINYSNGEAGVESNRIASFLRYIGIEKGVCSREKKIPWSIFMADKLSAASFIRAYYEGDGSYLRIVTGSKQMAKDLKIILLKLGAITKTVIYDYSEYNNLPIYNIDIIKDGFFSIIKDSGGLKSSSKIKQVAESAAKSTKPPWYLKIPYTFKLGTKIRRTNLSKGVLIKDKKTKVIINRSGNEGNLYGNFYLNSLDKDFCSVKTNENVSKNLSFLQFIEICDYELFCKINKIKSMNVIWDRVLSCDISEANDTWDLSVENQHHYIAEGFVVHNTDSVAASPEQIIDIRSRIVKDIGTTYLFPSDRIYSNKDNAQIGHPPVIPTFDTIPASISSDDRKLLQLITDRFMASQMADAIFDQASVRFEVKGKKHTYEFRASGSVQQFDGFLKVYGSSTKDNILPPLKNGQKIKVSKYNTEQHFTKPPARYTDPGSFTDKMEKEGIGRPATYAATMDTLVDRGYVERDKQKIKATEAGMMVSDYLSHYFKDVTSSSFTAQMETELDEIAAGSRNMSTAMTEFYDKLMKEIETAKTTTDHIFKTDMDCSKCNTGNKMIKKISELGVFMGCEGWPTCGHTINFDSDGKPVEETVETGYQCPICGNILKKHQGPYGEYYRCDGSACSFIGKEKNGEVLATGKSAAKDLGIKCPTCGKGDLLEREGQWGPWVGCSTYPKCKYKGIVDKSGAIVVKVPKTFKKGSGESSGKDTGESCPTCKVGSLIERKSKYGSGSWFSCNKYPSCKYKR